MSTLENILLATFLGSLGALIGGIILISQKSFAVKVSHFLAAFAAGTFLGAAFFDLIPEAIEGASGTETNISTWVLFGIVIFFLLERFIHWFHHHESVHLHEKEGKSTVPLIILGDTAHNFVDGVVIAATFLVNPSIGIVTTIAVVAHEIPQEIGDFGLLLHKGMSRVKTIAVNALSACAAFTGALITYFTGNLLEPYIPVLLALTAGFFIYIATSDLIPEINYESRRGFALIQCILLIIGILFIYLAVTFLESH